MREERRKRWGPEHGEIPAHRKKKKARKKKIWRDKQISRMRDRKKRIEIEIKMNR